MLDNELEEIGIRSEFARKIAVEISEVALGFYNDLATLTIQHKKSLQDHVSLADRTVEREIKTKLLSEFPQDGFLGEESEVNDIRGDYCWIVDPIDGTSPFVFGIPAWCISIALYSDKYKKVIFGVVYDPVHRELYHAQIGKGAFKNNLPVSVSGLSIQEGLFGLGYSQRVDANKFSASLNNLLNNGGMFIRNGSGALMLCYVAAGKLVGYYEPHLNIWDVAAALLIIEEAGGTVSNFLEKEDYFSLGNYVLATNCQTTYDQVSSFIIR